MSNIGKLNSSDAYVGEPTKLQGDTKAQDGKVMKSGQITVAGGINRIDMEKTEADTEVKTQNLKNFGAQGSNVVSFSDSKEGHINELQKFLKSDQKAQAANTQLLFQALETKNPDIGKVQDLIKSGVNLNAVNKHGRTPLHMAVEHNNVEAVRVFIEAKADVNATKDYNGITPLQTAAMQGYVDVADALIEEGKADMNAKSKAGYTALDLSRNEGTRNFLKGKDAKSSKELE
jgi:ankyrin repeat protein